MAELNDIARVIGSNAARFGAFIGKKVADGYRAVDPDVMRHVVQVPLLAYSLLVPRSNIVDPGEADGHPPLIFVHGLGGNRGNFLPMSLYLKLYGRRRSYKIHFGPDQSTEQMSKALVKFIRSVIEATGEDQVDIVAHSLGGIITRLAIADGDLGSSVRTLITLGTPHGGTVPARYANTSLLKQLRPDSDLIMRLSKLPLPENIKAISLWSRNDIFVLPAESAQLEGAKQIDMTPFTHYSYLIDRKGWSVVASALSPSASLN